MCQKKTIYPFELEACLQLIDTDPAALSSISSTKANQVYEFIQAFRSDLEEIFLDTTQNLENFSALISKYEKYDGFSSSTIYTHIKAYISALQTEEDNDLLKGTTAGKIYDDHRKLRLIMDVLVQFTKEINT